MNNNLFKKAVVLITVLLLSASVLSGCGKKDSDSANESKTSTQSDNKEPLGKYVPSIDMRFVRTIDGDLSTNVLSKTPGETIEDNRWLKLYKEQLGINIKYDWTLKCSYSDDAFKQKINVAMASSNLPDVIPVNSTQLKQLVDSDMVENMTQYFQDYASTLTKDIYYRQGTSVLDSGTFNGELLAMPNIEDSAESAQYIWIRADWLKKLGLQPPKTMDDVLKISEAFTKNDPDGNGKADTYGLAITKNLYGGYMGLEGFFAGYNAYPNFWKEDSSGKLVYGSVKPEVKVALQKLADMYKTGQLDKEFGVKDGNKVAETIASGKIGINYGEQWNPMYPLINNFNNDFNADWTAYPIVSESGKPAKVPLKFRTSLYFAVKKGYKHPEALVKLYNLYLEKNCGESSKNDYNKYFMPPEIGNVGVWKFSPISPNPPYTNQNIFLTIDKARKNNDISTLSGSSKAVEANLEAYAKGDKSQWGWDKIYGVNGAFSIMQQYQTNNQLMIEKFVSAPTATMVEKKSTLDKLEKEEFVKIIMGAAPISEFDKFVSDWNELGGESITKEVNEWYSKIKGK